MPRRSTLRCLVLFLGVSCSRDGEEGAGDFCAEKCEELADVVGALAEAGGHTFDAEVYSASCQAKEATDCDTCWRDLSALMLEDYGVFADCWCTLPSSMREATLEEEYDCERVIADDYGTEEELRAECECL